MLVRGAALLVAASACAAQPASGAASGAPMNTLEAYRWSLQAATDGQGKRIVLAPPERPFVFGFSRGRVDIEGPCNRQFGGFQIDAYGRLSVARMASTMKACEPALMQADAALADLLAQPMKMELTSGGVPTLRLTSAENATLVLTGQMTPEARYGASTTIFLEVAAQPVACNDPLRPAATCLQVRERRYDEKGLQVGTPGAWRPLYEPIEGFTHRAGERNVLRLKRFQRNPVPADASANVYVLDLIVESEIVKP
jgi:heat shock protein HslJ